MHIPGYGDSRETTIIDMHRSGLPRVPRDVRWALRLYTTFPSALLAAHIRRRLRLPGDVGFSPGFACVAGRLVSHSHSSWSDTLVVDYAPVVLGRNSGFGFRNTVITSTHDLGRFHHVICRPVVIGDNVWVTSHVVILPGVHVGDNSVIGAGSVVTRDVPANVFAAGNPCRVIKPLARSDSANISANYGVRLEAQSDEY
jgi:maltose O-acetyltransferase